MNDPNENQAVGKAHGRTALRHVVRGLTDRDFNLSASLDFPIYEKAYGQFTSRYDFEAGYFRENSLEIIQNLHCWDLIFEVEHETNKRDGEQEKELSFSYGARLTAQPENFIEPFGGDVYRRTVNYR